MPLIQKKDPYIQEAVSYEKIWCCFFDNQWLLSF